MPTRCPVFQEVFQRIRTTAAPPGVPAHLGPRPCALPEARTPPAESVARRLHRTLNDPHLTAEQCYAPVLRQVIDWPQLLAGQRRVVVIIDESTMAAEIHLLRA